MKQGQKVIYKEQMRVVYDVYPNSMISLCLMDESGEHLDEEEADFLIPYSNVKTFDKKPDIRIYYLFRCDDKRRPETMQPDESYNLDEHSKVYELKSELDAKGINYDLLIERFDADTDEVLSNDYIVGENYKNDLK
jgi:hypothetical protein